MGGGCGISLNLGDVWGETGKENTPKSRNSSGKPYSLQNKILHHLMMPHSRHSIQNRNHPWQLHLLNFFEVPIWFIIWNLWYPIKISHLINSQKNFTNSFQSSLTLAPKQCLTTTMNLCYHLIWARPTWTKFSMKLHEIQETRRWGTQVLISKCQM